MRISSSYYSSSLRSLQPSTNTRDGALSFSFSGSPHSLATSLLDREREGTWGRSSFGMRSHPLADDDEENEQGGGGETDALMRNDGSRRQL